MLNDDVTNLTRADYAAHRAWLQGLPQNLIASRYLSTPGDGEDPQPHQVQVHLQRVHNILIYRAHQHAREDLAADLQAKIKFSDKGISKAVDAVHTLERLGTPMPRLSHHVELWYAPALAKRLRAANLTTIDQLITCCNERGYGWWRRVPRIGVMAAAAIVNWLMSHASALGKSVGAHVTRQITMSAISPARPIIIINQHTAAAPPLESIRLPAELSGQAGTNRADIERCILSAWDDYQAVLTWLSLRPADSPTRRAYRKEVERFLAWAVIERGKALSSLTTEDCIAYRDFLADPQPAERWCSAGVFARDLPGWRPFTGKLKSSSQQYAQTVLQSMCEFLTRKRYLDVNPWLDVPALASVSQEMQIEKALPFDVWERLWHWLTAESLVPENADVRQARATIALLRDCGLRRSEACRADRADLVPLPLPDPDVWGELKVVGKGGKIRRVPISVRAINAIRAHWLDLDHHFHVDATGPLLRPVFAAPTKRAQAKRLLGDMGISTSGLRQVVVRAATRFANALPDNERELADIAARLRPHALRHTFGTHAVAAGVEGDVLQSVFGHRSADTTAIYTQPGRARRLKQVARMYK